MRKLVLVLICPLLLKPASAAAPKGTKKQITIAELQNNCEVIGYLGIPLGQVATIDAVLRVSARGKSKASRAKAYLEVIAVDGKPLVKPVALDYGLNPQARGSGLEINAAQKQAKNKSVGKTFRLLVHESGGFGGIPSGLPAGVPAGVGFGFSSGLSVWKVISEDVSGRVDLNDLKALERLLATADGADLRHVSAALIKMEPGASRDRAIAAFVRAIAKDDAESAKAWAEEIADKQLRKSLRGSIEN